MRIKDLNLCKCGNRPEIVTQRNGLIRIACVLAKCDSLVCAAPGDAQYAWNETNPLPDEDPTLTQNQVPAEPYRGAWHQQSSVMNTAPTLVELPIPLLVPSRQRSS